MDLKEELKTAKKLVKQLEKKILEDKQISFGSQENFFKIAISMNPIHEGYWIKGFTVDNNVYHHFGNLTHSVGCCEINVELCKDIYTYHGMLLRGGTILLSEKNKIS